MEGAGDVLHGAVRGRDALVLAQVLEPRLDDEGLEEVARPARCPPRAPSAGRRRAGGSRRSPCMARVNASASAGSISYSTVTRTGPRSGSPTRTRGGSGQRGAGERSGPSPSGSRSRWHEEPRHGDRDARRAEGVLHAGGLGQRAPRRAPERETPEQDEEIGGEAARAHPGRERELGGGVQHGEERQPARARAGQRRGARSRGARSCRGRRALPRRRVPRPSSCAAAPKRARKRGSRSPPTTAPAPKKPSSTP